MCQGRCGLLVTAEDGKVVKVEPDRKSPLAGGGACPKGTSLPQLLNHPNRLRHPLRRIGGRGEDRWVAISWDEALGYIAEGLKQVRGQFGAPSVAIGLGDPKGLELAFAQRFASAFGTPNVATPGNACHMPRNLGSAFTIGSPCAADNDHLPKAIIVWGSNLRQTHDSTLRWSRLVAALSKGAKLIVIDPRKTDLASRADLWLRPRPASDGALALGMLRAMVDEELYDEDFVGRWTIGFDELRQHLGDYPLEAVEELTWVPRQQIAEATRLYAQNRPAVILWGNALDHTINSFQTSRAICILRAISGNIDIPGGEVIPGTVNTLRPGRFMLLPDFPRRQEQTLGGEHRLAAASAFIPRQALVRAIIDERPYPVKAALFFATNPLLTFPDAEATYRALMKLEMVVVADLFMTPTAALADIVLPAATVFEFDEVAPYPSPVLLAYPQIVEPPGECRSDMRIINELAKRVGLEEHFWADERQALDLILEPAGLSFEELKRRRLLHMPTEYRKHEKDGFRTTSGKVEIYSQRLKAMGYSSLPTYNPPQADADYPLLLTNAKEARFCHSAHRNIPRLRRLCREPVVQLNPGTAAERNLAEGEWVYIETRQGRIRQRLSLNPDLDPRVVVIAYGWWFPEAEASQLYGWREANVNVLTDSMPPYDPAVGSTNLRGIPCRLTSA